MRSSILALCLLSASPALLAQDSPQLCQMYEQERWQGLGKGSVNACLTGVDRWVSVNGQGYKFGYWAGTFLAANAANFYRSLDNGKTWAVVAPKINLASAPPLAPMLVTRTATGVPTSIPAGNERRTCSLLIHGQWTERTLTLDQCAVELDRAPDTYDAEGYKYGYWSGVFLVANQDTVFHSRNNQDWAALRPRWKNASAAAGAD